MAAIAAIAPDAAERIRNITALLGPDVAVRARQNGAWARDYTRGCGCAWTWRTDHWQRNEAATCRIHTTGQLMAQEVS